MTGDFFRVSQFSVFPELQTTVPLLPALCLHHLDLCLFASSQMLLHWEHIEVNPAAVKQYLYFCIHDNTYSLNYLYK